MHPKCAICQGGSGVPGVWERAGRAVTVIWQGPGCAMPCHMPAPGCCGVGMDTGAEDSSTGNHRNETVLVTAGVSSDIRHYFEKSTWNAWRSTFLFSSFKLSPDGLISSWMKEAPLSSWTLRSTSIPRFQKSINQLRSKKRGESSDR